MHYSSVNYPSGNPNAWFSSQSSGRGDRIPFSYPMFREIERGQGVFSGLIGWSPESMSNVEVKGVLSRVAVNSVTGNYYSELGTLPLVGRLVAPDDAQSVTAATAAPLESSLFGRDDHQRGGIPLKAISDSGGKPISIPAANRSGVGAKRRWHFDVAKTDQNRQAESVRSEAKAGCSLRGWECGARGSSPLPRLSTQ